MKVSPEKEKPTKFDVGLLETGRTLDPREEESNASFATIARFMIGKFSEKNITSLHPRVQKSCEKLKSIEFTTIQSRNVEEMIAVMKQVVNVFQLC